MIALAQIYHISDVPARADREANVQVMHDLLPLHTEDEIREKYDQLREDAGIVPEASSKESSAVAGTRNEAITFDVDRLGQSF